MKKVLFILPLAVVLFFACENKKGENTDAGSETEVSSEETSSEEKTGDNAPSGSDAATAKTYTVADFVDAYANDKESLKGQTVILEGYYSGFSEQKSEGKTEQYNVSLYADEKCEYKGKQAFFIFGPDTDKEDLSVQQYSKIKVQGKVTGEKFFEHPELVDAKMVK